jgi:PIN domain nuclease of toxin-antitoxin system
VVEETAAEVSVSAATICEIEIKRALGRLQAPRDIVALVRDSGFSTLPISLEHACEAGRLPRHHDDPFDRVLIAQARLDGLTIATADAVFARYAVTVLEIAPD